MGKRGCLVALGAVGLFNGCTRSEHAKVDEQRGAVPGRGEGGRVAGHALGGLGELLCDRRRVDSTAWTGDGGWGACAQQQRRERGAARHKSTSGSS